MNAQNDSKTNDVEVVQESNLSTHKLASAQDFDSNSETPEETKVDSDSPLVVQENSDKTSVQSEEPFLGESESTNAPYATNAFNDGASPTAPASPENSSDFTQANADNKAPGSADNKAPESSTVEQGEDAPQTIERKDVTLKGSRKRLGGNGKLRAAALGTAGTLLVLGAASYFVIGSMSSKEDQVVPGQVAVPSTKAAASAIVTPEQAEHIRQQQIAAGESAEASGDTYLAPILTVGQNNEEELAPPTQPGLKPLDIPNSHTFKDKDGKVYTADQAAALYQQGVKIPGVTEGNGSISDPNLTGQKRTSNAVESGGGGQGASDSAAESTYQPYEVKPYVPNSIVNSNTVGNEFVAKESTTLDESVKAVDEWQEQYLQLRLKKANLVNQKTQLAFVEQVGEIEKNIKPSADRTTKLGTFSRNYYAVPVEKEEEPIVSSNMANGDSASTEFKPIIYAGETYRAILKNEVNTDNGNEVIAVLQNGPLKGSTLIGSVTQTANNIQFNFNRLLRKGKTEINISAIGRQIGTNSSGMADDIKKHYLVRYSALVASSALSGVGKSYEQTAGASATVTGSGTVVTNATDPTNKRIVGNAVGELGSEISNEVKDLSKKPTTYITNSGKVFNVFFNQNVQDEKPVGSAN